MGEKISGGKNTKNFRRKTVRGGDNFSSEIN